MTDTDDEDIPAHCQVAFGAECAAILALACVVSFKGMEKQRNKKVQPTSMAVPHMHVHLAYYCVCVCVCVCVSALVLN